MSADPMDGDVIGAAPATTGTVPTGAATTANGTGRLGRAYAVALTGISGQLVEIEACLGGGLPGVQVVGMPDVAVNEARDRIRAAINHSGLAFPRHKVTLALSPASLPKAGSGYDLALATAVLAASGQIRAGSLDAWVLLGELALDGRVRPVRGVLPAVAAAAAAGAPGVVVPVANLAEARLVEGIEIWAVGSLRRLVEWTFTGSGAISVPPPLVEAAADPNRPILDLVDVAGQGDARWGIEVAAAGLHHVMLTGQPGVGKTMLAERMPGLLPPLSNREALEVTAIHSTAGRLAPGHPLVTRAPFIAPHHSASVPALIGGGSGIPMPGAVSLAHHGILFIDECPEMSVRALEALRTPLEEGVVRIARRDASMEFPARFQLVLAANPCPCAPARPEQCTCHPGARRRYLSKLSGPLLDRIDIRVQLAGVGVAMLSSPEPSESTAKVAARVAEARAAAADRWKPYGFTTNSLAPAGLLHREFRLSNAVMEPLANELRIGQLSARGCDRCLRVAWSIADLGGRSTPTVADVNQALMFRDRSGFIQGGQPT